MNRPTRDHVFLSYAHEDLDSVRKVYEGLTERGLEVWFDKQNLGPGRWATKVRKAINKSRYFVICLSKAALRKTGDERPGFQDEELDIAYRIAMDQSETGFTIVPVRLEDCARGDHRLATFNQYDLFEDLEKALDQLAVDLGGRSKSDTKAVDKRTEDERLTEALFGKALTAYQALEFERALTLWDSVLVIDRNYTYAWYNKGLALGNLGRHEAALEAYDKALEINPDLTEPQTNRDILLKRIEKGNTSEG